MSDPIRRETMEAHTKRLLDLGVEKTATDAHARAARVCREADNMHAEQREGHEARRAPPKYRRPTHGRRVRIETTINNETGETVDEKVETRDVDLGEQRE